ncbi:cytochrome P450 [Desarmillaria tabescens]|uniref:Cytochrome P450 n=1 Tax=Armillaria tabescens TaxID=1929756 RepID=A0AA39TN85_ARMTA|nr:cytochrome P450 [Desarmillaria tabescens]KAK0460648.1 cytochrome P450 [Desarmillaria tabescens]
MSVFQIVFTLVQQMALEEYVDLARPVDKPLVLRTLGIATVFLLALQLRKALISRKKLKSIPTAGSSGIIGSWIDAFRFISHAKEIVEEGQRMYGTVFKVPLLDRWTVVVSGAEKINDLRKASVDQLSSITMSEDMDYAFGRFTRLDPYHLDVVRGALTRNIGACFADVQDEIKAAFKDNIPMTEDWVEIPAYETILQIVCRASNRMFVGLPLCRNREYIKLNINYTIEIFAFDRILHLLPTILKIIVSSIYTPRKNAVAKAEKFLGKTIRERLQQQNLHGKDWPGKPNDLVSWLLDITYGDGKKRTVNDLCTRVLALNTAAIHTTSMTFTTALYALAAHPEYAETLRNEVESIINEEGCTKAAMGKMNQLDSFVKEAQRVYGTMGVFGMHRTTRKDFAFSDGTVVPAGTQIVVASLSTHTDEENYEDPLEFKPWRFSEKRKQEGENIRHHMATPSLDFVFFGHGRPACPGRFFAVNELKALMSHVLLNFDVKIDKFPTPAWFYDNQMPNQSSKVLFRKRVRTP